MSRMFKVSATPHMRDKTDVQKIMYSVILALLPAAVGSVYFFGFRALWLIVLTIVSCVATEAALGKLMGKPLTIFDGSAVITGILLAFNLPVGVPWWIPVVGGVFGIAVGKMTFGGLGYNPVNPAILGRIFLLISWPIPMTTWHKPNGFEGLDAETVATPLAILKDNSKIIMNRESSTIEAFNTATSKLADLSDSYMDLFIGRIPGCIGETSVLLLLIGAAFLMYKHYIGWRIPFSFVATVGLFTWVFGGLDGYFTGPWLFHILSGGLIIGAFFMATDMVTSPITFKGRIIFGIGCGLITSVIRLWGGYPEGVSFSILLMNIAVPIIDRYTRPKIFGKVNK